jgi:hypothetical protein
VERSDYSTVSPPAKFRRCSPSAKSGGLRCSSILPRPPPARTPPFPALLEAGQHGQADAASSLPILLPQARGGKGYTPLEQQVVDLKARHSDVLLMVKVGYCFRFFGEDAAVAAACSASSPTPTTASSPPAASAARRRRAASSGRGGAARGGAAERLLLPQSPSSKARPARTSYGHSERQPTRSRGIRPRPPHPLATRSTPPNRRPSAPCPGERGARWVALVAQQGGGRGGLLVARGRGGWRWR